MVLLLFYYNFNGKKTGQNIDKYDMIKNKKI